MSGPTCDRLCRTIGIGSGLSSGELPSKKNFAGLSASNPSQSTCSPPPDGRDESINCHDRDQRANCDFAEIVKRRGLKTELKLLAPIVITVDSRPFRVRRCKDNQHYHVILSILSLPADTTNLLKQGYTKAAELTLLRRLHRCVLEDLHVREFQGNSASKDRYTGLSRVVQSGTPSVAMG